MEKKVIDLSALTERELLNEFADRFLAYEESGLKMTEWKNVRGYSTEDCETCDEYDEWDDLRMEHDEDWCRLRECVRFIKSDETLLEC